MRQTRHNRRSIRLPSYDYSRPGAYFLTLCTKDRACLFGEISDGTMRLHPAGSVVESCWNAVPDHFSNVTLDAYVIMPNHLHGILWIGDHQRPSSPPHSSQDPSGTSRTLGSIVRGFKIGVTSWMRRHTEVHEVWQRNYWEHVVRDEPELQHIREYIRANPLRWTSDHLYPY